MASSTRPPPPKNSGTSYMVAGFGMLIAMGGLIYWKVASKEPEPEPPPPPKVEKKKEETPVFENAPPPPPPIEDLKDAEVEKKVTKKVRATGGDACSSPCNGSATAAVQGALRAKGGQARGCYERALRLNATLEGRVMVAARIGKQGQVCSASIAQNSLGDATVASCITQMFRSGKFPAPKGGCVDVQVPLHFVPRK